VSPVKSERVSGPPLLADRLRSRLLRIVPDEARVSEVESVLDEHAADLSYHHPHRPDVVVYPVSTEEVRAVVAYANQTGTPTVPFGAGTSLEGHVIPLHGGISLDLTRLNAIVAVRPEDLTATVQAGVTRSQLEAATGPHGLWFPVDPGADATLGGMAATNASGTTTLRYGGMRAHVLALEVVLADGRVVRTGTRAVKTSAGYNLTELFVGSEGTLGVITEVTVRLYGIPEAISAAVCAFPTIAAAVDTVIETIQSGIPVARIELLDEAQIDAINKYSKLDHKIAPTLFFEFHGSNAGVAEQVDSVKAIAGEHGGDDFRWATSPEERTKLWQARHDAYYAALALRPGSKGWPTDVCVPISRLAECIAETKRDLSQSSIPSALAGHVGDGNFHLIFMIDPQAPEEIAEASRLNDRMVTRALAMEGTCTGEHGIGYGKMDFLESEHGDAVAVMRSIKRALDPNDILNPGKIVRI
jgi:D-lactate dehydrogenase (cytochrome)